MAELERGGAVVRAAGRMTAVMRAARAPAGPQMLRVARVERGAVVDEQLFRARQPVSVGASERATLFVAGIRQLLVLFEPLRSGYLLRLPSGARGRVAMGEEVVELSAIGSAERELVLVDGARGRLELAGCTLLFQLVDPPPTLAKPELPLAMRKGVFGDVDWFTTITAALSFLMHFFVVGLVYSDWGDPVVGDEHAMARILTSIDRVPAPPPLERPRSDDDDAAAPASSAASEASSRAHAGSPRAGQASRGARAGSEGTADARAAEIASQLALLEVDTLTALGEGGVATRDVLDSSEIPAAMLDDAAASRRGVDDAAAGLRGLGGDGSRAVRPGAEGERHLRDIGQRQARAVATSAGSATTVSGPVAQAAAAVSDPNGEVVGAEAVVARMRARFRHCYQRGIDQQPDLEGSVTLVASIGPNGEVLSVGGGGGRLAPIVGCLKSVVGAASFSPPRSGRAVLAIPIRFWRQP